MHICFVCREYPPSLRGGGIASYIKEVAHGLHDAGHRVTVIAASDDTRISSDDDEEGVRVDPAFGRGLCDSSGGRELTMEEVPYVLSLLFVPEKDSRKGAGTGGCGSY